jgi:hypothetical protein
MSRRRYPRNPGEADKDPSDKCIVFAGRVRECGMNTVMCASDKHLMMGYYALIDHYRTRAVSRNSLPHLREWKDPCKGRKTL